MSDDDDNWRTQLDEVYLLLREEFDLLAKAQLEPDSTVLYADPAQLSQIERRAMIRSAFALIEALVFAMKTIAVRRPGPRALSLGETALAREEDYELSDKGEVLERQSRLPFLKNLRFAFHLLQKTSGGERHLDLATDGWQALQRATRVRDRLMHPKWPPDLEVTDQEVHDTLRAVVWLQDQTESAFLSAASALAAQTQCLESETKRLTRETRHLQEETRRIRIQEQKIRRTRRGNNPPSA